MEDSYRLLEDTDCWAIKSTEIGDEFLSFYISTRELNSQPSGIQSKHYSIPAELSSYRDWWWDYWLLIIDSQIIDSFNSQSSEVYSTGLIVELLS
jgi:hypothetical protein